MVAAAVFHAWGVQVVRQLTVTRRKQKNPRTGGYASISPLRSRFDRGVDFRLTVSGAGAAPSIFTFLWLRV